MGGLFASGHAVDLIIAVLALEIVAFAVWRRPSLVNAIVAALPGLFLLLALRAALIGAGWMMIALWLALSLPAHLADLWRRPP